jgi:hypothetical protein
MGVDGVRKGLCGEKSRRSGAERWNKSDALLESGTTTRDVTTSERRSTGQGWGQDNWGWDGGRFSGRGVGVATVALVDAGCSMTTPDRVRMWTGASTSSAVRCGGGH